MRSVEIRVRVPGARAAQTFERLCQFERYPDFTDAVRRVTVTPRAGQRPLSEWEVTFRNGILRWSEEDTIDHDRQTITFCQIDGDFESFAGEWSVGGDDAGCLIGFRASFDLGMPSLAYMLDPVAESALRESILQIVAGLVQRPVEVLPPRTQAPAADHGRSGR